MGRKTYVCRAWPFFQVGGIQFRDGVYTTDDEGVQAMIEGSQSYGAQISLLADEGLEPETEDKDETEEEAEQETRPRRGPARTPNPGVHQGTRGTGNLR